MGLLRLDTERLPPMVRDERRRAKGSSLRVDRQGAQIPPTATAVALAMRNRRSSSTSSGTLIVRRSIAGSRRSNDHSSIAPLLLGRAECFVVGRPLVEVRKNGARQRRDVGGLVVFAGEGTDVFDRVEQHDGCELDLVPEIAAEEIGAV